MTEFRTSAVPPKASHIIDYAIHGADLQYVEIALDPQETVVAETGSMMFMEQGIQMDTKFGDGSEKNSGVFGSLIGAVKRSMTGENMFISFFTNRAHGRLKIAFAGPHSGSIVPIDLKQLGGMVYCQKGSFLCAAKGVAINVGLTKKVGAGIFGGAGFILQKLEGDGLAFVHAGGTVTEKNLTAGQSLYVDTGCIVGFQGTVKFDITIVRGVKNMLFGQEELFLSTLTGPGKVWIQSMPYVKFLATTYSNMVEMLKKKK